MNGRQYGPGNGPAPLSSSYTVQTPQDANEADLRTHTRDPSGSRGRGPPLPNIAVSNMQSQQANSGISPRSQSSAGAARSPATMNGTLERRPSATQNHYRQISRAQSNYPQSRNAVFVTSPTISPLSPETPGSVNTAATQPEFSDNTTVRRQASVRYPNESTMTLNAAVQMPSASASASTSLVGDRHGANGSDTSLPQKRNDRSNTSKSRSGHHHHRSHSRHHQEQKSVGEYALHHLFNKFLVRADQKIEACISLKPDLGTLDKVCGAGVDLELDQLISALAHINRQKPKPLVDTIMLWRKSKGDELIKAKEYVNNVNSPSSVHSGFSKRSADSAYPQYSDRSQVGNLADSTGYSQSVSLEVSVYQAEQKSAVAIYLLCRVLIEVYNKSDVTALNSELAKKIEEIIFSQLSGTEPEKDFAPYPFRYSNWKIYGQLLGVMSYSNFRGVSQRFLNELAFYQQDLKVKREDSTNIDAKAELLILAMQHLYVRASPDSLWRESCEFLYRIGEYFADSHGMQIKHAYCQILEDLVMPIAASWSPANNTQRWKDFLNMVNSRASQMLTKPKHWKEAFRLSIVVLCASPTDYFSSQWHSVATSQQAKLKDRAHSREVTLQAICRLVWTYLYRTNDSSSAIIRRLEDVMKVVLPSGKKSYLSNDPSFSEPIIELIRIIGSVQREFCFRNIIFPLINSELFTPGKDTKVEQLEPEKVVIGIRAFLKIMADLEGPEFGLPPFPRFNDGGLAMDPRTVPGALYTSQPSGGPRSSYESDPSYLSRPLNTSVLDSTAREFYARFCEILGKITLICDNAFGGQAVLDEKFGGLTPKTPLTEAFAFGRRDEHLGSAEHKQGFYELFHTAVQALPRCLSPSLSRNSLINLLCTGTAHVQSHIASSSKSSLKSLARQGLAQQVTMGFARFIFTFDARYSTMSDEGLLGPDHIESTLKLYIELLQIWIEEIKRKSKEIASERSEDGMLGNRSLQLDLTSVEVLVEEVEAHGVFFLCSQAKLVRAYAIKVLKIVTEFDTALGRANPRIIQILEGDSQIVMDINDEQLTVAERSRLQKGKRKSAVPKILIELCGSEVPHESTLWLKLFPNIIRLSYEVCTTAITLGRDIVCTRLLQMQDSISRLACEPRGTPMASADYGSSRALNRLGMQSPEVVIEQWKIYLVMACTTMSNPGAQTQSQLDKTQHTRKISRGPQQGQDKISSARQLFANIIPLLAAAQTSIRDAVVIALGSININLYRTLLESLQYAVTTCKEEAKQRIGTQHQRSGSNPRRNSPSTDRLRTEVTQVYRLTARFLHETSVVQDEWVLNNLCTYAKDLMIFLNDANIQNDWACQKLRRQYCGLMEELFDSIKRTQDPSKYISFDSRRSAFALMEDWGGYSANQARIDEREHNWQYDLAQSQDTVERGNVTVTMEIEKKHLKTAALSAMAALCAGPVKVNMDRSDGRSFDVRRMLSWIHQIFGTPSDKNHEIGRRALFNLIVHNRDTPYLLERSIERWYTIEPLRALESYFEVVNKVLTEQPDYPVAFWRILAAILFTLGNEKSDIRMKSAKILRLLEQRQQKNSKIQDFDISISDRTTAVYKLAQFEISRRLASQHTELAFFIFSQFSVHFKTLPSDCQRNMVAAILPWIQVIELQVEPSGGPTAQSYMLLANLLEITITASGALHNEIQALWQALATGPHGGNVQLTLDFVISLCLDRREQSFIAYAKQIIVYLSSTPAGQKVVEFLLLQITSRNMVQKQQEPKVLPPDNLGLPYVADLSEVLPIGNKQHGFSMGQLSMIFLVDLMVSPMNLNKENVPLLLQIVMVLWDHYTSLVQDQAREMLVHLIHELVITKIDDNSTTPNKNDIESFVESIRQHEPKVVWTYDEINGKDGQADSGCSAPLGSNDDSQVPVSMSLVTAKVVNLFKIAYPQIQERWAKICLSWATSCPVRHIACRSLQVFRCILTQLDRPMLSDILARLSNTIVDKAQDVQIFSLEILTTIRAIIGVLSDGQLVQYPQLFWTTCACLDTVYEREFIASLQMLEKLLEKIDFNNPTIVAVFEKSKPKDWCGSFEGVAQLVYKGLKSDASLEKSLCIINQVVSLPDNDLVGTRSRLLFGTLANLPLFLYSFENTEKRNDCMRTAQIIASAADHHGISQISLVLNAFARRRYASSVEFLSQILSALRQTFFPTWELKTLIFLIGLLTNRLHWYKLKTLEILLAVIQDVDTRRTEIASHGPDLISPLLRLLQTQYCNQALEVMDHIMIMSETPMSKQHIRMSFVGPGTRKERQAYDKTQSLYGIPEETGWSIPMPAVHTNNCRANMQAVYLACLHNDSTKADATPTPEIEFHVDEDQQGSYFPMDQGGTLTSEHSLADSGVGTMEGGMDDLLDKFNSLDDFFDDSLGVDDDTNRYSNITVTPYTQNTGNDADIYDQQTAPILQQSLNRTPSVSSIHNDTSYHDRYYDSRTPTSNNINPNPPFPTAKTPTTHLPSQPVRPALHSRSVTSPANNLTKAARGLHEMVSEDEGDTTLSEDERSTGITGAGAKLLGSTSLRGAQSSIRKMAPGLEGKDYRQRGLLRAQSRSKSQAPGSPRVPKVPEAYLQQQAMPSLRPSDTF